MNKRKVFKISLRLLLVVIFCFPIIYSSYAAAPPTDRVPSLQQPRQASIIAIDKGESLSGNKKKIINSLVSILKDLGFSTKTFSLQEINSIEFFEKYPSAIHLITNINDVNNENEKINTSSIYTRNLNSPKILSSHSASNLATKIGVYLTSDDSVKQRLKVRKNYNKKGTFRFYLDEGLLHLYEEDISKAINSFENALSLNDENAAPYYNLAISYAQIGNQEKRKENVEKGIKIDPNNLELNNEQARILISEGKYDDAIKILKSINTNHPIVQWNLAYIYNQMGETDKYKIILNKIVERELDISIQDVSRNRLDELKDAEKNLGKTIKALWVSFLGLIVILIIALISLTIHRLRRESQKIPNLSPKDLLAVKVQLSVALVSGLFSILSIVFQGFIGI